MEGGTSVTYPTEENRRKAWQTHKEAKMEPHQACEAQADYAPNPSNSMELDAVTITSNDAEVLVYSPALPDETILAEAARITSSDRNKSYGPPRDNHTRTAQLWNAYLSGKCGRPLNYRDVCWLNVLQKASRDVFCPKRDNIVDAAGFLRNIEMAENDEGRA